MFRDIGTLVMSIAANVGVVAILDFEACFPDSMVGLVPDHRAQINTLTSYRKSLIHECVTGQRRVTEADLKRAGEEP